MTQIQPPRPQSVESDEIKNDIFFMSVEEWNQECKETNNEFVIIGSSFCALGFVKKALENNPRAKIIMIERGPYNCLEQLPPGVVNIPHGFRNNVENKSKAVPWSFVFRESQYIKELNGTNNFFGGKSSFWSGWCPEPTDDEMRDWPDEIKITVHNYFSHAKKLLNVVSVDTISKSVFGILQKSVQTKLDEWKPLSKTGEITRVEPAPLAISEECSRNADYEIYSVSGPLLDLLLTSRKDGTISKENSPLKIMLNCVVKRIKHNGKKAVVLETNKGDFDIGNAKVILAMGTLPSTTLMLNSFSKSDFPFMRHVGSRFTAHVVSKILARVPGSALCNHDKFEMGAHYVAGLNNGSRHQFHTQIVSVYVPKPWETFYDKTVRHLPEIFSVPSRDQFSTSEDYVLFACAVIGELDYDNSDNCYLKNDEEDITTNGTLKVVANETDNALWDTMDESSLEMLDYLAPKGLEYWNSDEHSWKTCRPTTKMIRHKGKLCHEASTMRMGEDGDSPVGLDYRFKQVENVHLTGSSLWWRGGSWNPTCAMTGMAMHLADLICPKNSN